MIPKVTTVQADRDAATWCEQCVRDGVAFLLNGTVFRIRVGSRSPFHLCRAHVEQLRTILAEASL